MIAVQNGNKYPDKAAKPERPSFTRNLHRKNDENLQIIYPKNKIKIGIAGLSSCSGTTLFALAMVKYLANLKGISPGFVEISEGNEGINGWIYDMIGADKRFSGREFHSFYRLLNDGNPMEGFDNSDEGINWCLRLPWEKDLDIDIQQMTSLISNMTGNVIVCDYSSRLNFGKKEEDVSLSLLKRLLKDMSIVIFMVNPMPSKVMGSAARLSMMKEIELGGQKVHYMINMLSKGINKGELLHFLRPKRYSIIPIIPASDLFEAEYNCKNPYQMRGVKEALSGAIETVLGRLPDKFL